MILNCEVREGFNFGKCESKKLLARQVRPPIVRSILEDFDSGWIWINSDISRKCGELFSSLLLLDLCGTEGNCYCGSF